MKLIKLSSPGWEKDFPDKQTLVEFLKGCICSSCYEGHTYFNEDGSIFDVDFPIDRNRATLEELLGTPCGCEFMVEDEEEIS